MPTTTTTPRIDIYSRITNQIVADLERGVRPWFKPWNTENAAGHMTRPLRYNGLPYRGINTLSLWAAADSQGFSSPFWLTFQQAKELGGHVKKGEHGSSVVYAGSITRIAVGEDGKETEDEIPFLKEYKVFNAEQCEKLPSHFYQLTPTPKEVAFERIIQAETFVANTKAEIRIGGNQAYYAVQDDYIRMPPFEIFRDAESHAATLLHELMHWTGHPARLNRDFGRKRWGDDGYAMEELVAELGSAFLCADLRITSEVRHDHASYIDSWLRILKHDKRAVFAAASHATAAVDFLTALQPQPDL